jgi:hypothetical protein
VRCPPPGRYSPAVPDRSRRWTAIGIAVLVVGCVIFVGHVARIAAVFSEFGHVPFEDWLNASNTADRLLAGESLYHPEQLSGPYFGPDYTLDGLAYPPPSAVFFVAFRGAPLGLLLWLAMNVGLLVAGLVAIVRSELGPLAARSMPFVLAGLLAFPPFAVGVMWANLNVGLAGLFALCWVERARWTAVGAGLGALLKVYPGLLAVWRIRSDGPVRPLAAAAIAAGGISALTLPIVGFDEWAHFVTALSNTRPVCMEGSMSAACAIQNWLEPAQARLLATLLSVAIVAASALVRHKGAGYALLMLGLFVGVPDLHFHYWIFVYVAATAVIANVFRLRLLRTVD